MNVNEAISDIQPLSLSIYSVGISMFGIHFVTVQILIRYLPLLDIKRSITHSPPQLTVLFCSARHVKCLLKHNVLNEMRCYFSRSIQFSNQIKGISAQWSPMKWCEQKNVSLSSKDLICFYHRNIVIHITKVLRRQKVDLRLLFVCVLLFIRWER